MAATLSSLRWSYQKTQVLSSQVTGGRGCVVESSSLILSRLHWRVVLVSVETSIS